MSANVLDRVVGEPVHLICLEEVDTSPIPRWEQEIAECKRRYEQAHHEMQRFKEELDGTLGVERAAKKQLNEKLDFLTSTKKGITSQRRDLELKIYKVEEERTNRVEQRRIMESLKGHGYKPISMAPLTWRDENSLPMLAIFSTKESRMELAFNDYSNEIRFVPQLPKRMADCFTDVLELMRKKIRSRRRGLISELRLRCEFDGAIPKEVRGKILEAREIFGVDNVFLLAEPGEWSFQYRVLPDPDPLVIGYHEGVPDVLWLIDKFDTTPIEELVAALTADLSGGKH